MRDFEFLTDYNKLCGAAVKAPPAHALEKTWFSAKALVFSRRGTLLTLQKTRSSGQFGWDIPGGGLKEGETFLQAVDRELREELRLSPSGFYIPLSFSFDRYQGSEQHHSTMTFLTTFPEEISPIVNPEEHIGSDWKEWGKIPHPRTMRLERFLAQPEIDHLRIQDLVDFARRRAPLKVTPQDKGVVTPPAHPFQQPSLEG